MSSIGLATITGLSTITSPSSGLVVGSQNVGGSVVYEPGTYTSLQANTTLTTAQTIGGNIYLNTSATGGIITLPSAANVYAVCNNKVNVKFTFTMFSSYTATLAGTGWIFYGTSTNGSSTSSSSGSNSITVNSGSAHTFTCIITGPSSIAAPYSS